MAAVYFVSCISNNLQSDIRFQSVCKLKTEGVKDTLNCRVT